MNKAIPTRNVRIGDTLRLVNGSAFKPTDWSEEGVPIVRIQNLNDATAPFNRTKRILPNKFRLHGGELLFAWSGTPGTSFGAHIWRGGEAWLNQHIFNVLFDEREWDKRFLRYAINQNLSDYIREAHGGAGLAHITKGKFENSTLPQPSPPEQRRIVAEIEKQFSRLEEGVAALKRVQANLKRYRAAVLKAACEGRLVPTEAALTRAGGRKSEVRGRRSEGGGQPGYETGEQLLARILAERRLKWQGRGKYKEPAAPDASKLPNLPEGWAWATVEQLTSLVTSGSRGWSEYYADSGPLFIRAQDIKTDSLELDSVARVDVPDESEGMRSSVETNNLLITITGANVTKSAIVKDLSETAYVSQHVALLKPVSRETAPFCYLWIVSPAHGRRTLEQWAYGAGKPGLSLIQIRELPIPLPPLAEQARIVTEVERRLSVIDELESLVSANLQRAGRLRQAVLQKAFKGEL